MATLFLVRHGETEWNRSGQIMGHRPVPLSRHGQTQARHLAALLKGLPIHALLTSPIARAVQTAEILADVLGLPVTTEPGLTEIGFGAWEGQYWKDLADEIVRQNFYRCPTEARPPGGETLREVQTRAVEAVERATAQHPQAPLLCVSHADVIRAILSHYLQLDLAVVRQMRISHASLTIVELGAGTAELRCLNYPTDLSPP
jgi:broad specificity phosphatase PhoE